MSESAPATPHPAATVVLLRDGANGCEVLLVRRNVQLSFHGGAWVFPGGRIDQADYRGDSADLVTAARRAAAREACEEAGVVVAPDGLLLFSRWVTPPESPKRFDAWFFAGRASNDTVQIDGSEIHDHRWMRPEDALSTHRSGEIDLPPPTFVTLSQLTGYHTVEDALGSLAPFEWFIPRLCFVAEGACTLYAGDAGYDTADPDVAGPRHRLWMLESGWRYERTAAGQSPTSPSPEESL